MATVHIVETSQNLFNDVKRIFDPFGGAKRFIKDSGEVFIKVNAVDFKEHCYTPPDIIGALIRYIYSEGARKIYVIDNCTQGNFTRLVFRVTGLTAAIQRAGAKVVYLDEEPQATISLANTGYDQTEIAFPKVVLERLIQNKDRYTYINVPKFKTHCMTTVTLGIKNQWGFVAQRDRIADHNYSLHRKFVDILRLIKPDFTLIDAREAIYHGHYPARKLLDQMLVPYGLLVGGDDVVSVDSVGSYLLGFPWNQVDHVRLAHEAGLGQADLDKVEILGDPRMYQKQLTSDLLSIFPKDVDVRKGEDRCCKEGCASNVMACLQVLFCDFFGKGGFSIVMGKGHEQKDLERLQNRILVVGKCAVEEVGEYLKGNYGARNVLYSYGCNNLTQTITHLLKLMRVTPLNIVPLHPLHSLGLLAQAKIKGSHAYIPPLIIR